MVTLSELLLFLSFLEEEQKVKELNFICTDKLERGFFRIFASEKEGVNHELRINGNTGIGEASYFPPAINKNPRKIASFSKWYKTKKGANEKQG